MAYHDHNPPHAAVDRQTQVSLACQRQRLLQDYLTTDAQTLQDAGFHNALRLFHQAAERIPAYRDFLKKHRVQAETITTPQAFQRVPITTKENYLRAYPLHDLCWDGTLQGLTFFSSSSGSSGTLSVWPWGQAQKREGARTLEHTLAEVFEMEKYRTLFINCFAMGSWIAGTFTSSCMEYLSLKGYPLSLITPGLDQKSTFALVRALAGEFEQILFTGYPPFLKDLLEEGQRQGIAWETLRIKFFFAAEGFSERWRDRIHQLVGASDPLTTSLSAYGSADAALLAHETPLTIAIRRAVCQEAGLMTHLFSRAYLPTLAQYDPRLKYFEAQEQAFVFSTRSGIPLLRYDIGDTGGIYTFHEMEQRLAAGQIDMTDLLAQHGLARYAWKLPFVYLFGRRDLTLSFYGLLLSPEQIRIGLEAPALQDALSGAFVMAADLDAKQNPVFRLTVELAPGREQNPVLQAQLQQAVVEGLRSVNSEYRELERMIGARALPQIEMVAYHSSPHFQTGNKQRRVAPPSQQANDSNHGQLRKDSR